MPNCGSQDVKSGGLAPEHAIVLTPLTPEVLRKRSVGHSAVCRVLSGKHQLARAGLFTETRSLPWRVGHELGQGFGFWVWLLQRTH